jgi:hypothetical protein
MILLSDMGTPVASSAGLMLRINPSGNSPSSTIGSIQSGRSGVLVDVGVFVGVDVFVAVSVGVGVDVSVNSGVSEGV